VDFLNFVSGLHLAESQGWLTKVETRDFTLQLLEKSGFTIPQKPNLYLLSEGSQDVVLA
jgi:hypothetical protein